MVNPEEQISAPEQARRSTPRDKLRVLPPEIQDDDAVLHAVPTIVPNLRARLQQCPAWVVGQFGDWARC